MAKSYSVKVNLSQMQDAKTLLLGLGGKEVNKVLMRSINKTIGVKSGGLRRDIADEIRKTTNLTKSFIYKQRGKRSQRTFTIKRATVAKPTGYIFTTGANVPLIYYSNQRGVRKRFARRIYVKVKKAGKKQRFRHTFIPLLNSGHRGLFTRKYPGAKGDKGRKIRELYGPAVPDVFQVKETHDRILAKTDARLAKNLQHEVDFYLRYRR